MRLDRQAVARQLGDAARRAAGRPSGLRVSGFADEAEVQAALAELAAGAVRSMGGGRGPWLWFLLGRSLLDGRDRLMGSALTGRIDSGLVVDQAGSTRLGSDDLGQLIGRLDGLARFVSAMLSGPGLYGGLGTDPTDVVVASSGAPLLLVIHDDSGTPHFIVRTSNLPIQFDVTSGTLNLFARPKLVSGVTPAMATGYPQDVELVATDQATLANGLKLGAGSVTASSFTSWTEEVGVRKSLLVTS